jgi:hypothetical protein
MPGTGGRLVPSEWVVMRIAAILALVALLSGCAGSSGPVGAAQDVVGNERGGKISYHEGGMQAAMSAATGHCAKFGKKAQVTQMNPSSDGFQLGFECN